ncbi:MAG: phosphoribosylanthranilate isomerase [Bacteroidaceae bacterium]|nr:phosphoribosylanthranilate isomerase [Bacteroidaceae bacterium]
MIIKVCGLREAENMQEVERLGTDWMGFIFYPRSPRHVTLRPSCLPVKARRVGVFVNEQQENIIRKTSEFGLDIIQLHGNETMDFCTDLRNKMPSSIKIMKTIGVEKEADIRKAESYGQSIDYVLFETKCDTYGGSGKRFNWQWLESYNGPHPFILSGGIGPQDVQAIKQLTHPYFHGIDLNSRFESSPGIKNIGLLDRFLRELRK